MTRNMKAPIASAKSAATPHTAKKWPGNPPTTTLVTRVAMGPAPSPSTTVARRRRRDERNWPA
jgi:hypothetical protein